VPQFLVRWDFSRRLGDVDILTPRPWPAQAAGSSTSTDRAGPGSALGPGPGWWPWPARSWGATMPQSA